MTTPLMNLRALVFAELDTSVLDRGAMLVALRLFVRALLIVFKILRFLEPGSANLSFIATKVDSRVARDRRLEYLEVEGALSLSSSLVLSSCG